MGFRKSNALAFLMLVSPADALGMYDPQFCYILDGFLLIYGIIITALYVRMKCVPQKRIDQKETETYSTLTGNQSTYQDLHRDPENGRHRQGRKTQDDTYTRLQKKPEDTYREIQVKRDRRPNDQVYQGLSSATKDTYDALHMQPIPPRR